MTATPRTYYEVTCDHDDCGLLHRGALGESRAKIRKRLAAEGWVSTIGTGPAARHVDYCRDHTPGLITVSEALRRVAVPSKLEDLTRSGHGVQRDAATALVPTAHETPRPGQPDAAAHAVEARECEPVRVQPANSEQEKRQPMECAHSDLSQPEQAGSRVTRRPRGMSATDGLGQVARSTTIRNGGWNGAAPSAGISAFNPVSPPVQAADERDVSAIEVAAAQPAMLVRFGHALRCAWHGRFRKHDHCLECGRANLYGGFRCKRCRGRTRAVPWFLRGYRPRLRWPGTWYGGNPEHNPTGPAQVDLVSQPDAHPTAMGSDQARAGTPGWVPARQVIRVPVSGWLDLGPQFAPAPAPSWAEVLIQRVMAAQWDGTRLLLEAS